MSTSRSRAIPAPRRGRSPAPGRAAAFPLSDAFGAWRVAARDGGWHVDLLPLREGSLEADLAARDFTINALAEPLAGGPPVDHHGGRADLAARRLRMVSEAALAADPLRTLRAARLATELGLDVEAATARAVADHAPRLAAVAPERVFAELKRIVAAPAARRGLELMEALGVTAVVLPELAALHGVEQSAFHHLDVHDHTLGVLDAVAALQEDPARLGLGAHAGALRARLATPLANELTRGEAMRFAALLHDAAKPQTRGWRPDGRVTFIGHDDAGAELARAVLRRLRAANGLADYVAALTRHHLRLGFLVHERPLSRRSVFRYLQGHRALRGRRHGVHGRRPRRHPRPQRRAGHRRARRARRSHARGGLRPRGGAAGRAARARGRARRRARGAPRAAAGRAAGGARGGGLRGRGGDPRGRPAPRARAPPVETADKATGRQIRRVPSRLRDDAVPAGEAAATASSAAS